MNCNDTINEHDLFLENSIEDADTSFLSEPDDSPLSCNIDFAHGSPLSKDDFHIAHFNINSITADSKLDQLQEVTTKLNIAVLVCTESKLDETIPSNLIMLPGFHTPIRRDRNRHGVGCLFYIAESFTFNQKSMNIFLLMFE